MSRHIKIKKVSLTFCLVASFALMTGCSNNSEKEQTETEKEQEQAKKTEFSQQDIRILSEAIGHYYYQNLKFMELDTEIDAVLQGIKDAQAGKYPPLEKKEYFEKQRDHLTVIREDTKKKNQEIAERFLEENKKKPGMVSLEDGKVLYQVLKEGSGETVPENGSPLAHYEGKLIDDYVFASTKITGEPSQISMETAIKGLNAAVVGMKEGERRRIYIHPDLSFNIKPPLKPNSMVIFEVEIVKANPENE